MILRCALNILWGFSAINFDFQVGCVDAKLVVGQDVTHGHLSTTLKTPCHVFPSGYCFFDSKKLNVELQGRCANCKFYFGYIAASCGFMMQIFFFKMC